MSNHPGPEPPLRTPEPFDENQSPPFKHPSRPYRKGRGEGGGEYRARTGDLLVANQALSQTELIPRPRHAAGGEPPTRTVAPRKLPQTALGAGQGHGGPG